jgi:protein-S-isoprenylcysteine O-methyltransferase Ste14
MNLWVGAPLSATALLGGGAQGHPAAGTHAVATATPNVTTFDYLGIPAITGVGVALLSLLLSVWLIRKNESVHSRVPAGNQL